MSNKKQEKYLTIHGHFYQPPRENPWLEAIELQDSAEPFHDWNERINQECYNPNSVSKIVDNRNRILDVVNNYSHMSFNFGPTLLSWLEHFAPTTYERIIKADIDSVAEHNGHGSGVAQVYNHIIMPLANENDKQTQIKWGIRDFEYRFGRKPEGMWLAETAADDDTMRALVENGIKFTILSPFQAQSIKAKNSKEWKDVSWGNIDPARAYRYYIKSAPEKYIDLFFYDGAISQSVAFDELLKDGNKFIKRLKDGVSDSRNYPQLINIATDGESYGHHTKFGDMALAYVLKIKAESEGLKLTNYAEFLAKFPPDCEVDIKPVSSWSCSHGVGRWKEDCGCSTGGHPGWNQKWRKPLRDALNYLRDELAIIFEENATKYFDNPWDIRNKYINVILDRSDFNIQKFVEENFHENLKENEICEAMELLEMQRQELLMFTSCGWFFSEISGIENVQILKYAARAMQIALNFSDKTLEENFTNILAEATSNLAEHGNGKNIYEKYVKPSIVTTKQIASLWAISSLYQDFEEEEDVYCYSIKKDSYKKIAKSTSTLVIGHIEIKSKVTLRKENIIFALVQYSGGDYHCAIKDFKNQKEFEKIQENLIKTFLENPLTEIIRTLDGYFDKEYYTLKDIFIEERRKILQVLLKGRLKKFAYTYSEMYEQSKGSIFHLQSLGLKIPDEFKISAKYALGQKFNELINESDYFIDDETIQLAIDINQEAKIIGVELDKTSSNQTYGRKILTNINRLAYSFESQQTDIILELFDNIEKLELKVDISEAQNIYYTKIFHKIGDLVEHIGENKKNNTKKFAEKLLLIGNKLNINVEFYEIKLSNL
ncbi:MAG: DUF3536 domain-containing protein [Candidatus Gastranaerophilales bacterium]